MSNKPLRACPFCGGVAETDSQRSYRSISTGLLGRAVAVYCIGTCGTDMSLCLADVPDLSAEDALAVLVENWNKRTPAIDVDATIKSLCDRLDAISKHAFNALTNFGHGGWRPEKVYAQELEQIKKLSEGFMPIPACSICGAGHAEPMQACPTTHFAFLVKRPIDSQAWPTIFSDRDRAEAYPDRASPVVPLRLAGPVEARVTPAGWVCKHKSLHAAEIAVALCGCERPGVSL